MAARITADDSPAMDPAADRRVESVEELDARCADLCHQAGLLSLGLVEGLLGGPGDLNAVASLLVLAGRLGGCTPRDDAPPLLAVGGDVEGRDRLVGLLRRRTGPAVRRPTTVTSEGLSSCSVTGPPYRRWHTASTEATVREDATRCPGASETLLARCAAASTTHHG